MDQTTILPSKATKRITPEAAKQLFKDRVFPCKENKNPDIPRGFTWSNLVSLGLTDKPAKSLYRASGQLVGLDLFQADISVLDFDCHGANDYRKNPNTFALYKRLLKKCKFAIDSISKKGRHLFFKKVLNSEDLPSGWKAFYPWMDLKTKGGYIIIAGCEDDWARFPDFNAFFKTLSPIKKEFFDLPNTAINNTIPFGPHQNTNAIAKNIKGIAEHDLDKAIQFFEANRGRDKAKIKEGLRDMLGFQGKQVALRAKRAKPEPSEFLNIPQEALFRDLENEKAEALDYLDSEKIIVKNKLNVVTGPKGSGKSAGLISYLLKEGKRGLYFSDNENTPALISQYKKLAKVGKEYEGDIFWFDMSHLDEKEVWEVFKQKIKELKIDYIFEDPPFEVSDFHNAPGIRLNLGARQYWGNELKIGWILTRNYNKQGLISGFELFKTIPRCVIHILPILPTSKTSIDLHNKQKRDDKTKLSLLHSEIINTGKTPENSIILQFLSHKDYPAIPQIEFEPEKRPLNSKLTQFCKGPTQSEIETAESNIVFSLGILFESKEDGLPSGLFKKKIMSELKVKDRAAKNYIKRLIKKGLIEGGGSGPHSKNFKPTSQGIEVLNSLKGGGDDS